MLIYREGSQRIQRAAILGERVSLWRLIWCEVLALSWPFRAIRVHDRMTVRSERQC